MNAIYEPKIQRYKCQLSQIIDMFEILQKKIEKKLAIHGIICAAPSMPVTPGQLLEFRLFAGSCMDVT